LFVRLAFVIVLCVLSVAQSDSRVPAEVLHRFVYVNPAPKPKDFTSAMLWGIAIADTRVPGYENAQVEISRTQLTCRVDGKDITLNDDKGDVRGGLYRRHPWFGTDEHGPIPLILSRSQNRNSEGWQQP
jgi:hypothetical protein